MSNSETDTMSSYLECIGVPAPESAQTLCVGETDRAARLYILSGGLRAIITVISASTSRVVIENIASDTPLPEWLSTRLGTVAVSPCESSSFIDKLESLDVWDRDHCVTNSRGGVLAVLVMANRQSEKCIKMLNPHLHPDAFYRDVVNLFSDVFLGGSIHL